MIHPDPPMAHVNHRCKHTVLVNCANFTILIFPPFMSHCTCACALYNNHFSASFREFTFTCFFHLFCVFALYIRKYAWSRKYFYFRRKVENLRINFRKRSFL